MIATPLHFTQKCIAAHVTLYVTDLAADDRAATGRLCAENFQYVSVGAKRAMGVKL
ncbi:hypothetical protein JQX14_03375 [Sulfitobacter pseudonitzschiae]|uniref:Uncharacterized protein n=1 Tax=Pseudosulfitobacter pseudonitzschiae TaxID=1402135 RepID=A0A9Q2RYU3_9RHOB|nr:hypothetical protein [Pseudosulfitobacter pseudonitzschiae]